MWIQNDWAHARTHFIGAHQGDARGYLYSNYSFHLNDIFPGKLFHWKHVKCDSRVCLNDMLNVYSPFFSLLLPAFWVIHSFVYVSLILSSKIK